MAMIWPSSYSIYRAFNVLWSVGVPKHITEVCAQLCKCGIPAVVFYIKTSLKQDFDDVRLQLGKIDSLTCIDEAVINEIRKLELCVVSGPEPQGSDIPTDDFIIGDAVWVGGNTHGLIAFLGETQFAPGEWAGVVLNEPVGKNDGAVSGIRYFQCEAKRGVFSRISKLNRASPPIGSLQAKRPTPTATADGGLKIGDRVLVSGSKPGILKYIGITDFAKGQWAGIELDEKQSKNDGAVAGKRYFDCRPMHGLFAPIHKVTKSSATSIPSTPVGRKLSSSSFRMSRERSGSQESVSSISSSASSVSRSRVRIGVSSLGHQVHAALLMLNQC